MVGGGEAVIFLEKPGRSQESKVRTRRWGQGCLEGLAVDASRCGWVVVEVGGQLTARAEAGIGFFSRRGWGFVEVRGRWCGYGMGGMLGIVTLRLR